MRTHYIEAGDGPPLLLLHGGGPANCAELTWAPNIASLARHFRVIVPDALGFGQTDHPTDDFTIMGRVQHMVGFVKALSFERLAVVGHSQGGFMAANLAIRMPEIVSHLVIVSSGTTAPNGNLANDGSFSPSVQEIITFSDHPDFAHFERLQRDLTFFPDQVDTALLRRAYDQMEDFQTLPVYVRGTEQELRGKPGAYASLAQEHVLPHLGQLGMPSLLVWGREDDFAYPERGLDLLNLMPGAEMHLLPQAKHMVMWDQPRAFERTVAAFCARE